MFNRFIPFFIMFILTGLRCALATEIESYGTASFGTVIVIPIPDQSDVSTTLLVAVGGAEDGQQEGLAHFAEHRAFASAALQTGYRGNLNGFTTLQTTEFSSVSDVVSLPDILEFYELLLKVVDLPEESFERERDRILYEIRVGENSPIKRDEICRAREKMYKNTPWRNCVIGQRSVIKNLQAEDIISFQKSYYNRENAILIIAGAINIEDIQRILPRTDPANWRGSHIPMPLLNENSRVTKYENDGRLLVAYQSIDLPGVSDSVEQSASVAYLSIWGLDAFETELSKSLQESKFLARNFELTIQPSGTQKALVSVAIEMESGIKPEEVVVTLEQAIGNVDKVQGSISLERRDALVREVQKPDVYHSLLLAHLRSRRSPFSISTYEQALSKLQTNVIQRMHDSLFKLQEWRFLVPSNVR